MIIVTIKIIMINLTRVSGFLLQLEQKDGITIMADRGLTIKEDMLKEIGAELNISPFMLQC